MKPRQPFFVFLKIVFVLILCLGISGSMSLYGVKKTNIMGDIPVIESFTIDPSVIYQGLHDRVTFRWSVRPGPGGSAIKMVNIKRISGPGPSINYYTRSTEGKDIKRITGSFPLGKTIYMLSVENEAKMKKTARVTLEGKSSKNLADAVTITSFSGNPYDIPSDSTSFVLRLTIKNSSGADIPDCRILVKYHESGPFGRSKTVGDKTLTKLGAGQYSYRVSINFVGTELGHYNIKISTDSLVLETKEVELRVSRTIKIFNIRAH